MKVAIVGTGYVGLVTGTCLAETGNAVTCVDIDEKKIALLKDGVIPIYEKGLEALVKKNYQEKRLHFTTNLEEAINACDIIMIGVGTPPREDGSADLQHVLGVATQIGKVLKEYKLIVTKSTVPVGTGFKVKAAIQKELDARNLKVHFSVASNPEFLKEGAAVADFMQPDRIIIGSTDDRGESLLRELYKPFVDAGHRIIAMDIQSAELCKYASNAMLATKISFMNELSQISEVLGADILRVREGMGADRRIGYEFTHAGLGYGGSCFPKDVKALVNTATTSGLKAPLLNAVEAVNKSQRERFIKKITTAIPNLIDKKIAIWGLSFKPDTDDVREAPALDVIKAMVKHGSTVVAYDPIATKSTKDYFRDADPATGAKVTYATDMYEALLHVDALVLCTEWNVFRSPDFEKMKAQMKNPVIFDGRNQYNPESLKELGFRYHGVGRS